MRTLTLIVTSLFLVSPLSGLSAAEKASHAHIGHVLSGWKDTPEGAGLMVTATKEAGIALQHAQFAAKQPDNLEWMKTHTVHVMHALDPQAADKGPGLGYGLIKASQGVAKHINLAANSDDASQNVKTHAEHVATSAENAVARAQQIMELAREVLDAQSASSAADHVARIEDLAGQVIDGEDANGDGQVSWQEGGLNTSAQHAGIMARGEGLAVAE